MAIAAARLTSALLLALGLHTLVLTTPAYAHREVIPTVFHDGRGSVWITVAWADGHPVSEPVVATINGYDQQGGHFGPAALRTLENTTPTTLVYSGTLAAGQWTAIVDIALPGTGYCSASFTVAPAGTLERIDCAQAATTPQPEQTPPAGGARTVWILPAAGLLLALAGGVLYRLRASRRRTPCGRSG